MIYLYDNALVDDLKKSFNPHAVENPVVQVIPPENITNIAAQLQNDEISFPLVAVTRSEDTPIDTKRSNFTQMKRGIQSVIDPKTNLLYYERAIPIELSYSLTVLTTNTADMDELIRELTFKYLSMYFLTIKLPYECNRKVRFGVTIDLETDIQRTSGVVEYLNTGQLYQSIIPLKCDGCVLVHYTPAHLTRTEYEVDLTTPNKSI